MKPSEPLPIKSATLIRRAKCPGQMGKRKRGKPPLYTMLNFLLYTSTPKLKVQYDSISCLFEAKTLDQFYSPLISATEGNEPVVPEFCGGPKLDMVVGAGSLRELSGSMVPFFVWPAHCRISRSRVMRVVSISSLLNGAPKKTLSSGRNGPDTAFRDLGGADSFSSLVRACTGASPASAYSFGNLVRIRSLKSVELPNFSKPRKMASSSSAVYLWRLRRPLCSSAIYGRTLAVRSGRLLRAQILFRSAYAKSIFQVQSCSTIKLVVWTFKNGGPVPYSKACNAFE
ncbi:hypothetical protein KC364_g20 [Hortaea werneckii]|nr:hypothetical protein KC364_g20 [Hortaea werneckii]